MDVKRIVQRNYKIIILMNLKLNNAYTISTIERSCICTFGLKQWHFPNWKTHWDFYWDGHAIYTYIYKDGYTASKSDMFQV